MNVVRGLATWLGAAVLASLLSTMVWCQVEPPLPLFYWGCVYGMGTATLFFTVAGSSALSLLFAGMGSRPVAHRYLFLVAFGGIAGGMTMLVLGGGAILTIAGGVYGAVTSCFWVGLHWAFDRGAVSR